MILIGSNGPSSTLRIGDVRSKESADTKPVNSPLDIMKSIYSSNDQNEIMKYFNNANQYINDNPSLFRQTLDNIFSMNDHVDLLEISKKNSLTPQDKMEIAIRTYSRCILKMKEMNSSNANIQDMLNKTNDLMASNRSYDKLYQISGYFMCNLYDTMAKKCPVTSKSSKIP